MSIFNLIKKVGLFVVFQIVGFLVSLRYRIKVKGLENIPSLKGAILLPNHPAEIDPVLVILALWKKFHCRPLVVEHFYYLKGFKFFMDWVGALPLPNLDTATNKWKVKQIEKLFDRVVDELKAGNNFLIYPAGRLKLTGQEVVGGASFVPNLLQTYPEVNVVLVRTSGLWGSRFSRAITGKVPNFGATLLEGVKILLRNGIFFAPRREVVIEVKQAPKDFPVHGARMEINRYLEAWYNEKGPEPRILISDKFWTRSVPKVVRSEKNQKGDELPIPPEIESEVLGQIASMTKRAPETIQREMNFSFDLGLDSLDVAQLYVFLDEKYDVVNLPHGQLQTVEDVMRAAVGFKREVRDERKGERWPKDIARPSPVQPWGNTIAEAFLHNCDRMGKSIACADNLTGALSYKRLKQAALILSLKMAKLPGDHIGVLLPSSNAAYLTIMSILLAKKVPVMLNWTTGVRSLNHAAEISQLKTVISSRRFLDKLDGGEFGDVEEKFVYLEDVKNSITLKEKLYGLVLSWKKCGALLSKLKFDQIKPEDPAVIIFTSGTESLPKGVLLSHSNILSNHRSAMQCVDLKQEDVLYGVLPPFHSFGFAVTGLLPLLSGLKVCFAPDPTDSHGMANDIAHWKPTMFICAPGFVKALLRVASQDQLASLQLIVLGAEKVADELVQELQALDKRKKVIEGYGITECSPIVTLNRPELPRKGVGQPIPGISLMTIHYETGEVLGEGQEGEICIAGPSVFNGYLEGKKDPFILHQGKKWYRSGDRGFIDQDGYLILSGRLKRFVKIGGEMVSLVSIEEELIKLAKAKCWIDDTIEGPYLAVSSKEGLEGRPQIILYATFDVNREDVNAALIESGFGRLAKVGEVKKVGEIPLTGAGKTHHRLLDESVV